MKYSDLVAKVKELSKYNVLAEAINTDVDSLNFHNIYLLLDCTKEQLTEVESELLANPELSPIINGILLFWNKKDFWWLCILGHMEVTWLNGG